MLAALLAMKRFSIFSPVANMQCAGMRRTTCTRIVQAGFGSA
jgi:hypothetical protein